MVDGEPPHNQGEDAEGQIAASSIIFVLKWSKLAQCLVRKNIKAGRVRD